MKLHEYLGQDLRRLHDLYEKATEDLTAEEWNATPVANSNSIGWNVWHYARTEDNVVRFLLQNRRPTVWMEGGYADALSLPPVAQGTGMSLEEAQGLRIEDVDRFRQYMSAVWASTAEFLQDPDEEALNQMITVRPLGEMPAIRALGQVCVTHGFGHAGHIDLLRATMNKSGIGI